MNEPTDEAYEKPTLTPVGIETATGRELDVLAEALYGLKRHPAIDGRPMSLEPDYSLRTRCVATGTLQANAQAGRAPAYLGIDLAAPNSERIAINVVADNEVIGQVVVDPRDFYPGITDGLTRVVADVTRMLHENLRASRGVTIRQRFEDADPDRVFLRFKQAMEEMGRAYGERLNDIMDSVPKPAPPALLDRLATAAVVGLTPIGRTMAAIAEHEEREAFRLRQIADATREGFKAAVLKDHYCGPGCVTCDPPAAKVPEIAAGDTWIDPEGRRLFVHSFIAEIVAWNVVVNDAQITTTMTAAGIHHQGKSTLFHRAEWDHKQPPAEPTRCDVCGEVPPGGNHAAHACEALASAIWDYEEQLAWLAKREAEIGRRVACCTIGGVHWMAAKPCPIHEKPRAPAPWTPSWDAFGFE